MKTFLGFFYSLPGYLYSRRHLNSICVKVFSSSVYFKTIGSGELGSFLRVSVSGCLSRVVLLLYLILDIPLIQMNPAGRVVRLARCENVPGFSAVLTAMLAEVGCEYYPEYIVHEE